MLHVTGPRSLSSIARVILDIARVLIIFAAIMLVLVVGALAVALFVPSAGQEIFNEIAEETRLGGGAVTWGALFLIMLAALGWLITLLVILTEMRRVFAALARNEVFERSNARRLRTIGFGLVGLEVLGGIAGAAAPLFAGDEWRFSFNPTGWFAIAVVFILAEVFREGARLRRQSELTI